MGKKGAISWLTAVKRAFRSPTKENDRKNSKEQEAEDEEKKREGEGWVFKKHSRQDDFKQNASGVSISSSAFAHQRHEIAMAVASATAAEAAAATAEAAAQVARLGRPNFLKEHWAAIVIQTVFRGYLGRRALRALRGLVKLQALVRGHNVRKHTEMTLRCMRALARVQARVRDRRLGLSPDASTESSTSDANIFCKSRVHQSAEGWEDRQHAAEEIQVLRRSRKVSALKREKALAYAFSRQMWRSGKNPVSAMKESDVEDSSGWFDLRMATRGWERGGRASMDHRDAIKTLEMDTPSPARNSGLLKVRSTSPRCTREERRSFSPAVHTPTSACLYGGAFRHRGVSAEAARPTGGGGALPNYMAATESARARVRSQSTPRQRPPTPERERPGWSSTRKRLFFPV